jgi:nicotinamide-nucleotide amidase
MASGAIQRSQAQVAVAVTGVAGPGGGTAEKPVGTVWLAWQVNGVTQAECHRFAGDRAAVREASVQQALQGLYQRLLAVG